MTVRVKKLGERIAVQRSRPRRLIGEIVAQIKPGSYRPHRKLVNDTPVGREIW